MMLAKNTSAAKGQEPLVQRYTTPLKIVSRSRPNTVSVFMTGKAFAGIYMIMAAISRAQVRTTLLCLRTCSGAPQRGQCTCAAPFAGRLTRSQA